MDTGINMANFAVKPDEIIFLSKYSNAESQEEKDKLEKEYNDQVKAYWDWMKNANKKRLP